MLKISFSTTATHLYLANDVGQPLAAGVLALYRLIGDAVGDDEEDFGEV